MKIYYYLNKQKNLKKNLKLYHINGNKFSCYCSKALYILEPQVQN